MYDKKSYNQKKIYLFNLHSDFQRLMATIKSVIKNTTTTCFLIEWSLFARKNIYKRKMHKTLASAANRLQHQVSLILLLEINSWLPNLFIHLPEPFLELFIQWAIVVATVDEVGYPTEGLLRTLNVCHMRHVFEHKGFRVLRNSRHCGGKFYGNTGILFAVYHHYGLVGLGEELYHRGATHHTVLGGDNSLRRYGEGSLFYLSNFVCQWCLAALSEETGDELKNIVGTVLLYLITHSLARGLLIFAIRESVGM